MTTTAHRPRPRRTYQQVADTYRRMAAQARYRPAAPSDGFGTIVVPLADLDIDSEARAYAQRFIAEEDEQEFWLGCPGFGDRPALVLLVEAARALCGTDTALAARLARMAADELDGREVRR